jgi:hypothetical protein
VAFIPQCGNRRTAHRHYQPLLAQRLGPQCKKEAGLLPFSSWSGLLVSLFLDYPWDYLLSSSDQSYKSNVKTPLEDVKFSFNLFWTPAFAGVTVWKTRFSLSEQHWA